MSCRRTFLKSVVPATAGLVCLQAPWSWASIDQQEVRFVDIAGEAGLTRPTIFGGESTNRYLLETTGCGVALFDYDNDGWLDIFLVNGTRLEGSGAGANQPSNRLYKNNRDGTFTDVTERAGLARSGWGQGVCVGDFNNDGFEDLFVTYYGKNLLYRNNGDGTFTEIGEKAGVAGDAKSWSTGCAFVDYNRDGLLDLFVANYVDFDVATAPSPEQKNCSFGGMRVMCGPMSYRGGRNVLYRNNGDGTFTDVSEKSGVARNSSYGLGVSVADFDDDGWPDIYVANDSAPSMLFRNQRDGTFLDVALLAGCALSPEGQVQSGMGVAVGDYDRDGLLDIAKSNFSGDAPSLYHNRGKLVFDDHSFVSKLGMNTKYLGWGVHFLDYDNDGWPDLLFCNGHVFPDVKRSTSGQTYEQKKLLYRNRRDGTFEDISDRSGPGITVPTASRGCAVGDFDNDGDLDFVVNAVNGLPQLVRCDSRAENSWIKLKLIGKQSNRSAIGARAICISKDPQSGKMLTQIDEVRSGSGYISQSDLRLHFGLGKSQRADRIEIRWPNGAEESVTGLAANALYTVREGEGVIRAEKFPVAAQPRT